MNMNTKNKFCACNCDCDGNDCDSNCHGNNNCGDNGKNFTMNNFSYVSGNNSLSPQSSLAIKRKSIIDYLHQSSHLAWINSIAEYITPSSSIRFFALKPEEYQPFKYSELSFDQIDPALEISNDFILSHSNSKHLVDLIRGSILSLLRERRINIGISEAGNNIYKASGTVLAFELSCILGVYISDVSIIFDKSNLTFAYKLKVATNKNMDNRTFVGIDIDEEMLDAVRIFANKILMFKPIKIHLFDEVINLTPKKLRKIAVPIMSTESGTATFNDLLIIF